MDRSIGDSGHGGVNGGLSGKPADGGRARLLLVDDHDDTCRVTRRLLQLAGYEVETAAGVSEALAKLEAGRTDLLICDLVLPDGDGWGLMEQAKRRGPVRGIVVSGRGEPEDLERSLSVGFSEHLTKPLKWEDLADAIRRSLPEGGAGTEGTQA